MPRKTDHEGSWEKYGVACSVGYGFKGSGPGTGEENPNQFYQIECFESANSMCHTYC